jgi:phosphate-selective porin OprO and OprP
MPTAMPKNVRLCLPALMIAALPHLCRGQEASTDVQQELDALRERVERLEGEEERIDLAAYWDSGLRIGSPSGGGFKLRIGGRLHNDWAVYDADLSLEESVGEFEPGTEFRRADLYVEGTIYDGTIDYKMELEFSGGIEFQDAYIGLRDLPIGTLRIGHDEEEFSMDELTSNKYIMFMERALPNSLKPGTNTGISLRKTHLDRRLRWAVGAFRDTAEYGQPKGTNDYGVTARFTALPVCSEDRRKLLHLGLAGSTRRPANDQLRYKAGPESHLSPDLVDTDTINADGIQLAGAELGMVLGPLTVQAEYITADVDAVTGESFRFSGYYAQAGYFLTGDHHPYDLGDGVFGRVIPKQNFSLEKGTYGALELAARYSHLDLEDGAVNGGKLTDVTVGLNWHMNANTRLMLNYVMADAEGRYDGKARVAQLRMAVDF